MKIRTGDIIGGCLIGGWILVILLFGVSALVGLISGEIFLPDKKGGGGTLHGATARIVSLIILAVCSYILTALLRARRRRGRPVHPWDQQIDRDLERMRERRSHGASRTADDDEKGAA